MSDGQAAHEGFWGAVPLLGLAQILGWGSLYYTVTVLAGPIHADTGIDERLVFGAFTASLLVSGLSAPTVGRLVDRWGGRWVMVGGSALAAAGLAVVAASDGPVTFVAGWIVLGLAMAASLYDALFGAISAMAGASLRRGITAITLVAGFASTAFWPMTHALQAAHGWRSTLLFYAALNAAVCLPIYAFTLPHRKGSPQAEPSPPPKTPSPPLVGYAAMALAFALSSFVASAVSAHLVVVLGTGGASADAAILVGAFIGPMQVLGRLVELSASRWSRPATAGTVALALTALAFVLLGVGRGGTALLAGFVVLYGASYGVMTIVRGVVPAELFGRQGYGARLGRLARPAVFAKAVAPVAFSAVLALGMAAGAAVWGMALLSLAALACYQWALWRGSKQGGPALQEGEGGEKAGSA